MYDKYIRKHFNEMLMHVKCLCIGPTGNRIIIHRVDPKLLEYFRNLDSRSSAIGDIIVDEEGRLEFDYGGDRIELYEG